MILQVKNVLKEYDAGLIRHQALRGVSFESNRGEFVSLMGPSGSGKSTLLNLIGGLDLPTQGQVEIEGKILANLSDDDLSRFRRKRLGFIFQFFNLLPTLSAIENVALPRMLDGESLDAVEPDAHGLLEFMGIGKRAHHRPDQLSGGEMQRVAIARALVTNPALILADEPTGNLDSKSGELVLDLLRRLVTEKKQTILMVTHDPQAARFGTRLIRLKDGLLDTDERTGA